MAQSVYNYIGDAWRNMSAEAMKSYLIQWRRDNAALVVDRPFRLDKARMLGYKAKKGFVVVRVRLLRGGRKREQMGVKGRKSRKQHIRKILKMSYQWVAEIRASRKFPNLEVLNSYFLAKDGKNYFYEVLMVDPDKPEIKNDKTISWISKGTHTGRAERGLTSAGKKSRGLGTKSRNMKVRPSLRSWGRKGK